MKSPVRLALSAGMLAAALGFAGASSARGQVFFRGNFPLPHGRISIGVGNPYFTVGSYVPAPYVNQIFYQPDYGYGFRCDEGWVSVGRHGSRWFVTQRPIVIRESRAYRYGRDLRRDDRYRSGRNHDRGWYDRRHPRSRYDRDGYGRYDRDGYGRYDRDGYGR